VVQCPNCGWKNEALDREAQIEKNYTWLGPCAFGRSGGGCHGFLMVSKQENRQRSSRAANHMRAGHIFSLPKGEWMVAPVEP
jgi:hypothetical protein